MQKTSSRYLAMDEVELYFEHFVYAQNHPNCFRRYNIEQLSIPLCEFIDRYEGPQIVLHRSCKRLIVRIIETHRMLFKLGMSRTCYRHLVHVSLYVAARVAFRCKLPDSEIVARLLSEIYRCDKSLRRIVIGAYMEPTACIGLGGIHPVYSSKVEGIKALKYFLHHANVAKKTFFSSGIPTRMPDLSLRIPQYQHPAVYALVLNSYSTFKVLVDYGANLCDTRKPPSSFSVQYRINKTYLEINTPEREFCTALFFREHPVISGLSMPSLMQISRLAIRKQLNDAFQLPHGIKELPIPEVLRRYVSLD